MNNNILLSETNADQLFLNNTIGTDYVEILEEVNQLATKYLSQFAQSPSFSEQMSIVFGDNIDFSSLQEKWKQGDITFPTIEVRSLSELGNAWGAFAQSTNKIYLAKDLLENQSLEQVLAVFLEEYGHFIDVQINEEDAPGDEGAIFSALVLRKPLDEPLLQLLKQENDVASVTLEGQIVQIEQANINGDDQDNYLVGTDQNDNINAGVGDDTVNTGLGNDYAYGGEGNDLLIVDYSVNNSGGRMIGNGGYPSSGGQFTRYNGTGQVVDQVNQSGFERFKVTGTPYADVISGGDGNDVLIGGAGNDTIYGLSGKDTIEGGDGNDLIEVDLGSDSQKADNLDGGLGTDTVSVNLSNQTADITFDSTNPIAEKTFADGARVANFEVFKNIYTGSGNDRLVQLGNIDNSFSTGAGDDTVNTGLGYDYAYGGEGNDLLIVDYSVNNSGGRMIGNGGYPSSGGQFTRYNRTGQVVDQVNQSGFERFKVTGTPYADVISGGDGNDVLIGGAGNDTIYGLSGKDTIEGGDGNDLIEVDLGSDSQKADNLDGGLGTDTVSVNLSNQTADITFDSTNPIAEKTFADGARVANFEVFKNIKTGSGNDRIVQLGNIDNSFSTGAGDDTVNTGLGNDFAYGGEGNDLLIVDYSVNNSGGRMIGNGGYPSSGGQFTRYNGTGQVVDQVNQSGFERFKVTGTPYADVISGSDGDDVLIGGGGADSLTGDTGDINEVGNDTYILDASNAAGSSIQDFGGTDSLILENAQIALVKAQPGKMGLGRLNTSLIVDLNQDGVLNLDTDLSIENFYADRFTNTVNFGFLENVGNVSGNGVLGLQLLDSDMPDMGTLSSPQTFNDFVGNSDPEDFYRFHLSADSQVNLALTNAKDGMMMSIIRGWGNANAVISGTSINTNLFAGDYFVQIYSPLDINYTLDASANSILDQAGNSLGNARNLGLLMGNQTFSDFVGDIDPVDFYRFELSKPSTLNFSAFNFSGSNNIQLVLLDHQGNGIAASSPTELDPGTYYLEVDWIGYNSNYNLNLEAIPSTTPVPLQIQSVTPDAGSNGGTTTITVEGTQFTPGAKLTLIATDGTVREASQVTWYDNTTLAGTFNLQGLATGVYDVRIEDKAGTVISNDVFTVNSQPVITNTLFNNDNIELSLVVPSAVRPWWTGEVTVTYRNTGNSDIIAPLLTLSADKKAKMRLDGEQKFDSNSLQFLAGGSDAVLGVLSPGETGSFTALFLPDITYGNTQINFSVDKAKLYQIFSGGGSSSGGNAPPPEPFYIPITFDWESIKPTLKPESISDNAWDIIWSNFIKSVGMQVSQYQSVLAENANYLSQLGETTNDVSRLLAFELLQANNFGSIAERHTDSVLGKGQVFPWAITITTDSDGNVTVKQAGTNRLFEVQPNGSYLAETGDEEVLTLIGDTYQLREQSGILTVFRTEGKFDYIEDTNSNRIQSTYTGNSLTKLNYSNGDSLTFDYNAQGRISKATDQAGRVTTYGYDTTGELLTNITTPDGTTTYSYITTSGASQYAISSITYADGSQSLFQYDTKGRLSRQSLNGGAEALTYSYDSTGGVTITDASGAITKQFLNDRGQIARVTDPLNRTIQYRYDTDGNLTQIVAPGNTASSFAYDAKGNLLSSSDPLGHRVDFTYEANYDQLATVRDQKGNLTSYGYDPKGNLTQLTYADSSSETFSYDAKGNLTVSANRRGQTIQYTYDAKFQLIRKDYPGGSSGTFTYDTRGNLLTARDGDSNTSYTYDSADRLTKVTDGDGRFVAYSYDAAGRRTQMADQLGNVVKYSYDALGRLSRLNNGSNALIASYTYDAIGQLSRSDNGNGTYTKYSYDVAGQLLDLVNYKANNSVNSRFDYTYDALGRRTSMTTLEGTTNYGYDATGQLTSVSLPTGRTIQYQYDAAGNRIVVKDNATATNYSTNNLNQYTSVGGATYTYDTDGNLIAKTEGSNTSTYAYDAENRLISVTTAEGTWNYEYDALGNRIASVHNGQRTEYLLDPTGLGNVVGEYDGSGNLVVNYTYGLGLESRNGGGSTSFYDFDAIGSVAGLTGGTGTYLNQYSYLPFGENLTTTESVANPFEYVGQWGVMDEGNGLDFMRARFYESNLGRFTAQDPLLIAGGNVNLYQYGDANPLSYADPTGLQDANTIATFAGKKILQSALPAETPHQRIVVSAGATAIAAATATLAFPPAGVPIGTAIVLATAAGFVRGTVTGVVGEGLRTILSPYTVPNQPNSLPGPGSYPAPIFPNTLPSPLTPFLPTPTSFPWNPTPTPPATPNTPGPNAPVRVVVSLDPNDVVGPAGFGTQGWLTPNQTLPYAIRFENAADAGAPAVFITVTQQLDSDLDWTTFQLGDFGFGNFYIDVPDGFQNYSTRVDARNTIGYFVDFTANLNQVTGQVTYTLTTIDPFTGQLPTDVNAGFLPPNNDTHDGEGFVGYKIEAKPNLTTGTELTAEASIVFDTNDPINTPIHLNTVDKDAPSSSVSPLPATTTTDTFTVSWSGSDTGSGIASYDIYSSVDGGEFGLLLDDTTDTSATFAAEAGKTYAFYSVVVDNVGNTEAIPTTAQATTTITGGTGSNFDIDGNGQYSASVDGLLFYGYLNIRNLPLSLRNSLTQQLADNLINPQSSATRKTGTEIASYLESNLEMMDIDGNGQIQASIDGLLAYGYMNIRSLPTPVVNNLTQQLADNLIPDNSTAIRDTGAEISSFIESYIV